MEEFKNALSIRLISNTDLAAGGNRAGGFTASIVGILALMVLRLASSGVNARTNITPCAIIQWLFLWKNIAELPLTNNTVGNTNLAPQQTGISILVEVGSNLHKTSEITKPYPQQQKTLPDHKGRAKSARRD